MVVDSDDKDKQTLCQMAEEANVVVHKRWREVVDIHMARFEEMTKGLVDPQVRGTQVWSDDLENNKEHEREELSGER